MKNGSIQFFKTWIVEEVLLHSYLRNKEVKNEYYVTPSKKPITK